MSENSKKMHKETMKGLLCQSLMPSVYVFAVSYTFALRTGTIQDWNEAEFIAVTLGSIIIAASPIIAMYFIKPYRLVVKSLLPGSTKPVESNSKSDATPNILTEQMVQVTRFIHNFCCSSALLVNILLVTIIVRMTPNNLRTYSIVLLNFAYIEIVTAIASLMTFHRIMDTEGYMLTDFTGLCQLSGSKNICTNVYAVMMHGHSQYCLLIAFSFCYRYYVIKKSSPKKSALIASLVAFYIPTVLVYVICYSQHTAPRCHRAQETNV
ncbi:hypothetical protein PRIPAC_74984 [Pristionchus pacificus]|uniref:G protein-coupled receptor n=1 Tax=Pristionchus pacificus TaxID=54126 RepID=A0A2A6C0P6_PRIPA|nr:hypothetical protein PRIPAC_74984 [Pristionchus pacificus]|eukprot:PDM71744.1 G protein-coupled receptor [Pristionchus pacificus]